MDFGHEIPFVLEKIGFKKDLPKLFWKKKLSYLIIILAILWFKIRYLLTSSYCVPPVIFIVLSGTYMYYMPLLSVHSFQEFNK